MNDKPLKILLLEDSLTDAELIQHELKKSGLIFVSKVIETKKDFEDAVLNYNPDVILSDHSLPQFNSTEALAVYKKSNCIVPFILVTGAVSEEFAVQSIKNGFDDYILKSNLIRLPSSISNALEKRKTEEEKRKAQEELVKSEIQIRNFANHLHHVLEEERAHIAREIHDELGQQLVGIKMSVSSIKNNNITTAILADIETAMQSLRKIATKLRPGILDTLGLIPSIEWLAKEFEKKNNINCHLEINVKEYKYPEHISICFFRICQEALTNISKHAEANRIIIKINQEKNSLSLKIQDNGKGIQTEKLTNPFSMGLLGMRERAKIIGAELQINSKINSGTEIELISNLN